MLTFSEIPDSCLFELIAIEQRSHSLPLSGAILSDYFTHYRHFGVFLERRLLAFVFYQTVIDEGEIIHLVCDSDYQGRGIASRLMQQLIESQYQQGTTTWYLEVRESNTAAINLYRRLGFDFVGRRKSYYRNHEDALLMQLHRPDHQ